MTIVFNSKGNPVNTYDEYQRGFRSDDINLDDEEVFPDGSLMGEDE